MTKKEGTILIIDDNKSILLTLDMLLAPYFSKIICLNSPNLIPTTLRENPNIDVALLDMNFAAGINTGGEGLYWLNQIKSINPDISVVLFTAFADIELAVRGIKEGATDFVQKPWDNTSLIVTLKNAYKLHKTEKRIKNMQAGNSEAPEMFWGTSQPMKMLRSMVEKVAATDANILIMGENGTGKDMLAHEIYNLSNRSAQILVNVDMGAITESLFESELFGHIKGSFTDAKADRIGKFEAADGGTLFLDEIGNMPYHLQAKLLAALQNRCITKVGANSNIPINIRLITATNRNLHKMVVQNKFREDLLYRINTISLEVPPLRERREDIVPLTMIFAKRYATKYDKQIEGISPQAQDRLQNASWAGNIRELQHTVEKAVIMSSGEELRPTDFSMVSQTNLHTPAGAVATLEEQERNLICKTIEQYGQNLSQAAQQLGITRQTLYNKIKKYNL